MNKEQVLQDHLSFKKTSVQSIEKIKDIERYVGRFLNSSKKPLDKFTEKELTDFLSSFNGSFSVGTINNVKVYLKVFIKWYYPDYSLRFRNLDRICRNQKPPKTHNGDDMLSLKDVEKLIEAEQELEWKTFWLVFFYGGFRPSECCVLKWSDVVFDKKGVIIKAFLNKNKKKFYKSLPGKAEHYLKEWKKFNSSEWVFPSPLREGKPMGRKTAYFRLRKLSKRVLGKEIYPYILRHSIATIKYNDDNLKDELVANQMGHSESMKKTYTNLDEGKLITNARKIWAKAEELPPEKKHNLEEAVKILNEENLKLWKAIKQIMNKLDSSENFKEGRIPRG